MRIPKATQLPSGTWRTQVCSNGIRKSFTAETEDKAVRAAMLFLLHDDGSRIDQYLRTLTVGDAIDTYIEDRRNVLSPSTVRGYKQIRDNRFQKIMETPLSDPINWQAVVNAEARLCNAKTLKNAWSLMKSALKSVDVDVKDPKMPQVVRNERPFFTPDQIKIFVKAIEGDRYELPYLVCLHGLRQSEMLALKKENIQNGFIRVRGAVVRDEDNNMVYKSENKNKSSFRNVPVLIDRINDLVDALDPGAPVCTLSGNAASSHLARITKNADLPVIRLHSLRHSFASLCYHLGLSELECMRLGGWSDINVMRKIYTHISEEDVSAGAEKLRGFFLV